MFEYEYVQPLTERLAEGGDLEGLKEAVRNGAKIDGESFSYAAAYGHFHIMEYLRSIWIRPSVRAQGNAAMNGRLDVLEWLNQHGYLVKKNRIFNGCKDAAGNGHLDCLTYLHENGVKWDEETTQDAARYGHLDCLKYAHENGCPWNYLVYFTAKHNGHREVLQYLEENGCPQKEPKRSGAKGLLQDEIIKISSIEYCNSHLVCYTGESVINGGIIMHPQEGPERLRSQKLSSTEVRDLEIEEVD